MSEEKQPKKNVSSREELVQEIHKTVTEIVPDAEEEVVYTHSHHSHHHHSHSDDGAERRNTKSAVVRKLIMEKIPLRFVRLLVPEVVCSLVIWLLRYVGLFRSGTVSLLLSALALYLFWSIQWKFSKKTRHHMRSIGQYYACTLVAYVLFLLVAAVLFFFAYITPGFPDDFIYCPFFRLSYVLALETGADISTAAIPFSFGVFYGGTLLLTLLEPGVSSLRHLLQKLSRK